MTDFDKEQLQAEMEQKARELMSSGDAFDGVVKHFLDGFAYRYLETPLSQNIQTIKTSENIYSVESRDDRMVEVLKISNRKLKEKLIAFAKSHSPKEKATVAYRIQVTRYPDRLVCQATIDWGYPKHSFEKETSYTKESVLEFDDLLIVRNKLALHLEEVCSILL